MGRSAKRGTDTAPAGVRSLHQRLRARQAEIEEAILARVLALAEPEDLDADYARGLRGAVGAAIEHGLSALELGEDPIAAPPALLAQARLAARSGARLDAVMRRYVAGQALLADFVVEEAEREGPLPSTELKRLLRAQASAFDRLLDAISEEHYRERASLHRSGEERRAVGIERLLAGEQADAVRLSYDLDGHHLGILAHGPAAPEAIREAASALDRRLLAVRRKEETVWAWLGGRRPFGAEEPARAASMIAARGLCLAIGEPARGLSGWRLTHRQAKAALPVALRGGQVARYADVALLALAIRDELLAGSLRQIYLAPLEEERDGGQLARETLRAYFKAGRNASSAGALLGVSRQAVTGRLKAIEAMLRRPLTACAVELEIALGVEEPASSRG